MFVLLASTPSFFLFLSFLHRICSIRFKDMLNDCNYRPICHRLIPYDGVNHRELFTIKFVRSVCFWRSFVSYQAPQRFNHSSYMGCWPFAKHTFKCMFTLCVFSYSTRLGNYEFVSAKKKDIFSFRQLFFFPLSVMTDEENDGGGGCGQHRGCV